MHKSELQDILQVDKAVGRIIMDILISFSSNRQKRHENTHKAFENKTNHLLWHVNNKFLVNSNTNPWTNLWCKRVIRNKYQIV